MKLIKNSSLFFSILFVCFSPKNAKAQQANDSLVYYYNLYINAKENVDFKKVYLFFNQHKEESLQKKDTSKIIFDLRILASIEYKFGRLHKSDATAVSALQLLENLKASSTTTEAKIGIFNHLGIVAYESGNYNRAIEFYDRILQIAESPQIINIVHNNKANTYLKKKKYQLSIDEFTKVYQRSLKLGNKLPIARSLDNLGFAKSKLNLDDALPFMLEALQIREQEQNIDELFVSYKHLSEYFVAQKNPKMAHYYANKAHDISIKTKNPSYTLESLSLLINADTDVNVIAYKKLNDSISLAKQKDENTFVSIQYDYNEEKRKADDARLKLAKTQLEEEKQKRFKLLYLFSGLLILLGSIFLYFILKTRHKKEKLLEVYKTETRISKKVHDEVANDIYHVMIKMQKNINDDKMLDDLEDIYTKTREISKENSAIDVRENFDELVKDLLQSYKSETINVITKNSSKVDWLRISDEKKTAIYRILQELMTNMKKHSKASIVVLAFDQSEKLTINYSDNGVGCVLKKGNGLLNTENRIQAINGTIIFESHPNEGFKAKITV